MNLVAIPNNQLSVINSSNERKFSFRKVFRKIGRLAGKAKAFFATAETKITFIVTYWALETVILLLFLAGIKSMVALSLAIAMYLYGSYAMLSSVNALISNWKAIMFEGPSELVSEISKEINIVKTVVEQMYSDNDIYSPTVTFFSDSDTRQAIVSFYPSDKLSDTVITLSEIMHLYPVLKSHAAVIFMVNKVDIDEELKEALNIFVVSHDIAWYISIPFFFDGTDIYWASEDSIIITHVDDQDFDDLGKDMVTMLYLYSHMNSSHFTLSELLSYYSTKNVSFHLVDKNEIPAFYDFSHETNPILIQNG